ncbi:MAG: hypothetical protein DHS20C21_11860 [Gemmatimonadota bacterium]|nr:MAG: hypothetical protein DHS20C21_11860 [Gemmatimonadota bacterium]
MLTRSHRLAFLKVLAAVAWADGVVEAQERNRIKVLFNSFDLDEADRKTVDALLDRPVDFDEAVELTKEFAGAMAPPGAKQRLLDEIETLLGNESGRAPEEDELLEHVRAILASHTVLDGFAEKLRGLFSRTLFSRKEEESASRTQIDEQFLNDVMDDRPEKDIELQRICAEYCRHSTMKDRLRTLSALFSHAAEDRIITKREADHIYRIAHLLWISNPEYHAVRDRFRDRMEG